MNEWAAPVWAASARAAPQFQYSSGTNASILAFSVDDEAKGDALYPPCAQAEGELAPDQGGDVVSHDSVEHPSTALRVVQVLVELARVADPVLDALLRDLVELDALGRLLGRFELLGDVPRNGLSLAVGVGGEQNFVDVFRRLFQLLQDLFFAWNDLVRLLKALLDIDAELLGEVLDVSLGCDDVEPRPQVLLDRLGLRGRLDDDERLDHQQLLFRIVLQSSAIVSLSSAEEARRALYYYVLQSERQERGGGRLGAHPRTCRDRIGVARRGRDRI